MSVTTITDAQRYELGYRCGIAANETQRFINNTRNVTAEQAENIEAALAALADALAVAGYGSTPEGSATIEDGSTITVVNSAGTKPHDATANITGTSLENAQLVLTTAALVDHTDTTEIRRFDGSISGVTTATARVGAGVLSNVRLPVTADVVIDGNSYTISDASGGTASATVDIGSNGAISSITLGATTTLVADAETLTGVAPTGTYTDTVTFTVAGGAITAITLS